MTNLVSVDLPVLTVAGREAAELSHHGVLRRWARSQAPETRRNRFRAARAFAAHVLESGSVVGLMRAMEEHGSTWTHNALETWRHRLVAKGLASGTINNYLLGISSLVMVGRQTGLWSWRVERVSLPPEPREDRSGPPWMAVRALLESLDRDQSPRGLRDTAIVKLLAVRGLRRAEVTSLRVEDLDLAGASLKVRRKGKRELQSMPLPVGVVEAIGRWLRHRGAEPGPLFHRLDRPGVQKALSGDGLRRMLAKRCREAGLPAIRPHGLRHSGATRVGQLTHDLVSVQAWGSWEKPETAARYLDDTQKRSKEAAELLDHRATG